MLLNLNQKRFRYNNVATVSRDDFLTIDQRLSVNDFILGVFYLLSNHSTILQELFTDRFWNVRPFVGRARLKRSISTDVSRGKFFSNAYDSYRYDTLTQWKSITTSSKGQWVILVLPVCPLYSVRVLAVNAKREIKTILFLVIIEIKTILI